MADGQPASLVPDALELATERLGPLPLLNHLLARLELDAHLERFLPTRDRRVQLPFARGIGVLLRSILVEREPIYRQAETVATFAPEAFGLTADQVEHVGDDAIGRALDRLFDADRASLLTAVVVTAGERFGLRLDELHNDSTSIRFCGQYRQAQGRSIRGKRAPFITYGYSKDHRPDLKQLLFVLTTSADGAVPLQFRCEAGNHNDSRTHEQTWDALVAVAGRTDFLYVADSKLCNHEAMRHIDGRQGRFVCVLPRSRHEDRDFREWIQTHEPSWALVWDRPNPRRRAGPRDRWWTWRDRLPSAEGWPVVWVKSILLARHQERSRRERIAQTVAGLERIAARLSGPRPRRRSQAEVREHAERIVRKRKVARYVRIDVSRAERHEFRQAGPGRPGANTRYVRRARGYWKLTWTIDDARIAYDAKSDGMYPLLTNDRTLTDAQVLEAHKRQPAIEKRFEQVKTVLEIAPVLLKNEGRVEALFFVYFLTLLVQALLERELRAVMKRVGIAELPLYPEERMTSRPTAEQILRLFSLAERHVLSAGGRSVRTFHSKLTPLQRQVLAMLGVPPQAYGAGR
jgi:transposase